MGKPDINVPIRRAIMFKPINNIKVRIIGAGLAGSEAAYQLLKRGVYVELYDMKPKKFSPAHKSENFAELVCSNSLKSNDLSTASGLLKQELRMLDSLLISVADKVKIPAGSALAVDREKFSELITNKLKSFNNLKIISNEVVDLDLSVPTIIATGPLSSDSFSEYLSHLIGEKHLYFYDAIAPIISYDSIDFNHTFVRDRYNKGESGGDYVNIGLNKEEYFAFHDALIQAETVTLKEFETLKVFEGCMPIEVLAKRGIESLRFGPLKPVGLTDDEGKKPYAVIQLRKEKNNNDSYNIVGFQTNLTFNAQREVISSLPALKNAEFLRYGTMHKNTYINFPKVLNKDFNMKTHKNIFFAGQLSGVEGYVESIASGLVAGLNMFMQLNNHNFIEFGNNTLIGALQNYLCNSNCYNFQPMSVNMGLLSHIAPKTKNKGEKNSQIATQAVNNMKNVIDFNKNMIYL